MKRLIKANKENVAKQLDILENVNSQIRQVQNELRNDSNYDFSQELKDLNRILNQVFFYHKFFFGSYIKKPGGSNYNPSLRIF